jgi:hypothetical protein
VHQRGPLARGTPHVRIQLTFEQARPSRWIRDPAGPGRPPAGRPDGSTCKAKAWRHWCGVAGSRSPCSSWTLHNASHAFRMPR